MITENTPKRFCASTEDAWIASKVLADGRVDVTMWTNQTTLPPDEACEMARWILKHAGAGLFNTNPASVNDNDACVSRVSVKETQHARNAGGGRDE
jgi:hypothetical protein